MCISCLTQKKGSGEQSCKSHTSVTSVEPLWGYRAPASSVRLQYAARRVSRRAVADQVAISWLLGERTMSGAALTLRSVCRVTAQIF